MRELLAAAQAACLSQAAAAAASAEQLVVDRLIVTASGMDARLAPSMQAVEAALHAPKFAVQRRLAWRDLLRQRLQERLAEWGEGAQATRSTGGGGSEDGSGPSVGAQLCAAYAAAKRSVLRSALRAL